VRAEAPQHGEEGEKSPEIRQRPDLALEGNREHGDALVPRHPLEVFAGGRGDRHLEALLAKVAELASH
jgi:hypothetical protein